MNKNMNVQDSLKIGIMGCGHLGQAIARSLISQGFKKENLLISYRGNAQTYQKLKAQGLSQCITTNLKLFKESGIVLMTIKPQDILKLEEPVILNKTLIVSCMAGVSIELLQKIFGTEIYRMMFSGPDTIVSGKGIATMYPEHECLKTLLRNINLTYIKTMVEDDLDIFTAGVCMPAAILAGGKKTEQQRAMEKIGEEYPLLLELYAWAVKVLPDFQDKEDKEAYIKKMITKGGITDAIINSLANGAPLDEALKKGIVRSKEIAFKIQQVIIR